MWLRHRDFVQNSQKEKTMDDKLKKRVNMATKVWRVCAECGMWIMFVDFAIIIVNIILRRFFNAPISGTTEIIKYLMLGCASFAIIENEWIDGNVNMLVLIEKFKEKARKFMLGCIYAATTVGTGIVSCLLIRQAAMRVEDMQRTPELHFPIWIPATLLAVCFCILVVVLIFKTCLYFWMARTGETLNFRQFANIDMSAEAGR
jgi:TRAP-type C4-dicarboxylate transport system permease small subunit